MVLFHYLHKIDLHTSALTLLRHWLTVSQASLNLCLSKDTTGTQYAVVELSMMQDKKWIQSVSTVWITFFQSKTWVMLINCTNIADKVYPVFPCRKKMHLVFRILEKCQFFTDYRKSNNLTGRFYTTPDTAKLSFFMPNFSCWEDRTSHGSLMLWVYHCWRFCSHSWAVLYHIWSRLTHRSW